MSVNKQFFPHPPYSPDLDPSGYHFLIILEDNYFYIGKRLKQILTASLNRNLKNVMTERSTISKVDAIVLFLLKGNIIYIKYNSSNRKKAFASFPS